MEEILTRIRQLETELEALKTKERGALDLLYPTQAVAAAGGVASIVFPTAGALPTNFKDIIFAGLLRGTKAATFDTLNITVNAVATGYYTQIDYGSGAAPGAVEYRNQVAWFDAANAANAPAGVFTQFEMRIFSYATAYSTAMHLESGVTLSLLAGGMQSRSSHGFIDSSQAVTSVTFALAGGNIAQNSYLACYGVSG